MDFSGFLPSLLIGAHMNTHIWTSKRGGRAVTVFFAIIYSIWLEIIHILFVIAHGLMMFKLK